MLKLKRFTVVALVLALLSLALAPEAAACHRYRRAYYGRPYRYSGVAGARYYRHYHGHSTRNLLLTVGAPAALGAGVGALLGGGKGAGVGALLGGGGGAAYYLLNHRRP
jgi:hypothetical protein